MFQTDKLGNFKLILELLLEERKKRLFFEMA
jgi:hypothetical protein